ncbi:uncharacterized protein [Macrobrachium rosenbergii]
MILSSQGANSDSGANSSSSKSNQYSREPLRNTVPEVKAPSERIFSSEKAKNGTSPPAMRDSGEVQSDTYKSASSLGGPFHLNGSYPAKENEISFSTFNIDNIHTVQNGVSYHFPKAATEKIHARSLSLSSLSSYPLNSTNYTTKSIPSYLLRSLGNGSLGGSLRSPVATYYTLSNGSTSLPSMKRSVTLQNQNVTLHESAPVFIILEPIPHPLEKSNNSFLENRNDAKVSSFQVNITTEQLKSNNTLQTDQSSAYLTGSPQTTPSEYNTTPTESKHQSDSLHISEESNSVTTQEFHDTKEPLLLTIQEASGSAQYGDFAFSQDFTDELSALSEQTPVHYTPDPYTYPLKDQSDHLLFPTNNGDNDTLSKEIDMEPQTENIKARDTENRFPYSNEDYSDTTSDYENLSFQSNYDFVSTNNSNETSPSSTPRSSETNSLFDVPKPSDAVIASSNETQSESTTETIDPVLLESEKFNSLQQSVPVTTSQISTYPSENPSSQPLDKMLNGSAAQFTRYHSSLQNEPEHIVSVKELEVASVLKFSNQLDKLYHLKQNVTISTSISLQSKNTSHTNVDQVPQNSTTKSVTFGSVIPQNDTLAFSEQTSESYISETSTYTSDDPLSSSLSTDEDDGISTHATEKFDETISVDFSTSRRKLISLYSEDDDEISPSEESGLSTQSDYQSEEAYYMNENDSFAIKSENQLRLSENILLDESTSSGFPVSSDQASTTPSVTEPTTEVESEFYSTYQMDAASQYSTEGQASITPVVTESTTELQSEYYPTDLTEAASQYSTEGHASTTPTVTESTTELQSEYYPTDLTEASSQYSTEGQASTTPTVTEPTTQLQSEYYPTDQTEAESEYSTVGQASAKTEGTEPTTELQNEHYPTDQTGAAAEYSTEGQASTTPTVTEPTTELHSEYYPADQKEAASEYSTEGQASTTPVVTEPTTQLQSEYYPTDQTEAESEYSTVGQASTTTEVTETTTELQNEHYPTDQTEAASEYSTEAQDSANPLITEPTSDLQTEYKSTYRTVAASEYETEGQASTSPSVTELTTGMQSENYTTHQTEASSEYTTEGQASATPVVAEPTTELYYSTDQTEAASESSTEGQASTTSVVTETITEIQSRYYPTEQTEAPSEYSIEGQASTTTVVAEHATKLQNEHSPTHQTEPASEYSTEGQTSNPLLVTEPSTETQSEYYPTAQTEAASEYSTEDLSETYSTDFLALLSGGDYRSDIIDYMDKNSTSALSLFTLHPDDSDSTILPKIYQSSSSVVNPDRTRSIGNSSSLLEELQNENLLFPEQATTDDSSEKFTYPEEMTLNLHSTDIRPMATEMTTDPTVTNINPITFARATDVAKRNISHAAELPKITAQHLTGFSNEWKHPSSNTQHDWRDAPFSERPRPNIFDIKNINNYYILPTFTIQNHPPLRESFYNYLSKLQSPWPYSHYSPQIYPRFNSLPVSHFNQNDFYHRLLQRQRYYYPHPYYQGSYTQNPIYQPYVPWQNSHY